MMILLYQALLAGRIMCDNDQNFKLSGSMSYPFVVLLFVDIFCLRLDIPLCGDNSEFQALLAAAVLDCQMAAFRLIPAVLRVICYTLND
jgi:hypothetical protein